MSGILDSMKKFSTQKKKNLESRIKSSTNCQNSNRRNNSRLHKKNFDSEKNSRLEKIFFSTRKKKSRLDENSRALLSIMACHSMCQLFLSIVGLMAGGRVSRYSELLSLFNK